MSEAMNFSLKRIEIPIEIEDEKGVKSIYTLKEEDSTIRDAYINEQQRRVEFDEKGRSIGIRDYAGLESFLLARCFYGPDNTLVSPGVIDSWPGRVRSAIFKKAKEINILDPTEPALKNS